MRTLSFLCLFPTVLAAQTAGSTVFRAILLPNNEVPVVNTNARGVVDVVASVVRDSSGQIASGTVDILARVTFAASVTATGLFIHGGATGQNGQPVFTTGLTAANTRPLVSGGDSIHIPIQVAGDDAAALAALRALYQNPANYYVNLMTADFPAGAIRGQLQPTQSTVLLAQMSSDQALPAPVNSGSGVAHVVAIGTRDTAGNWTSGEVYLSSSYLADDPSLFNGFHIHLAPAGATGPIGIAATLPPGAAPNPNGGAVLSGLYTEITVSNTTQAGTFTNLFVNPTSLYVDLHTTANPNGVMRAQLRPTESIPFSLLMDSANETLAPSVQTKFPATLTLYALRNQDGGMAAGALLSDIDYRFPAAVQVLGVYLHDAAAGVDGPVSMKAVPDFHSDSGFGNSYSWSAPISNVAVLNDLVSSPENHYANLHTFDDPAGAARAQLGPTPIARPAVTAVIGANLDKTATSVAVGSLVTIFGANLAKMPAGLSGWTGQTLPSSLDGVRVTLDGRPMPLIYAGPNQINAQVPVDLAPGRAKVLLVDSGNGPGPAFSVDVVASAPEIFFYPVPAVLKNANFSLVSSTNPAKAGDVLLIYATGLGQTSPALTTGGLVPPDVLAYTTPVTATIGGKPATVAYSIAAPGFAGLYQVAVTVPAAVTGSVPLVLQQGAAASNSVNISVQ
jgi:uncharacterized protein (TIGR03437 family)